MAVSGPMVVGKYVYQWNESVISNISSDKLFQKDTSFFAHSLAILGVCLCLSLDGIAPKLK